MLLFLVLDGMEQSLSLWPFYAEGYGLHYPLDRWLGGSQGESGQF